MPRNIKEEKGLLYEPAPFVDPSFWEQYNKLVKDVDEMPGTKRLRFVWGMDRLEFCDGEWERRYLDTENDPPKYVGKARWIIEGWQPPTVYDKDDWMKNAKVLGPWPSKGVWDFVAVHESRDEERKFLPLDQSALNHLEMWAYWQGAGAQRSLEVLMNQKRKLKEFRDAERKEAADRVSSEFGEQVVREFEKAKDTPDAYSLPSGFTKSEGGLIVPA